MTLNVTLKAVIAASSDMSELDRLLAEGWYPISVTAQYCATGSDYHVFGGWLVILEKRE